MSNYTQHLLRDWNWFEEYKSRRGNESFHTFVDSVYLFLTNLKPGAFFNIEKGVKPDNVDLFIKVCCMFISEYVSMSDYYEFSNDATVIRRIANPEGEKHKLKKNKCISTSRTKNAS